MVCAISVFMEFCYLVWQSTIDKDILAQTDTAVGHFHQEQQIFIDTGIHVDFSLPQQHSLVHYQHLTQQFGAPNSVFSSITESKHIKGVKEPWRQLSQNEPLSQMLLTNQRLGKLAAAHVDFEACGMLDGSLSRPAPQPPPPPDDLDLGDVEGITSLGDVRLAK
jgi:hypothetical protein